MSLKYQNASYATKYFDNENGYNTDRDLNTWPSPQKKTPKYMIVDIPYGMY